MFTFQVGMVFCGACGVNSGGCPPLIRSLIGWIAPGTAPRPDRPALRRYCDAHYIGTQCRCLSVASSPARISRNAASRARPSRAARLALVSCCIVRAPEQRADAGHVHERDVAYAGNREPAFADQGPDVRSDIDSRRAACARRTASGSSGGGRSDTTGAGFGFADRFACGGRMGVLGGTGLGRPILARVSEKTASPVLSRNFRLPRDVASVCARNARQCKWVRQRVARRDPGNDPEVRE